MSTSGETGSHSPSIVVTQKAWKVNVVFGFLMAVFAAAVVRGHMGATTDLGRIVVDALFGALLVGAIAVWLRLARHPAQLEISPASITLSYREGRGTQQLHRASGDLYVRWAGGRYPQPYLRTSNSSEALPLWTFNRKEVARACIARGWEFAN